MGLGLIYKCVRLGENNTLALWLPDGPVGGGGFLADLLSRWGYDEPTILPVLRRFGENMPERSTVAPSRSVAKPLRIHGNFKSFGPGRVSILEATGAGIKTGKVKLSDYGNFDARCGTAFLSGSRLPCFNHFAIIQSLPCHAAVISTPKVSHGV